MFKVMSVCFSALFIYLTLGVISAQDFQGEGTYYGRDATDANTGACYWMDQGASGGMTVAINQAQWEDGGACGKCVLIHGEGEGLGADPITGPHFATVTNLCPECQHGDIDLGVSGDGRWQISWSFVDCGGRQRYLKTPVEYTEEIFGRKI